MASRRRTGRQTGTAVLSGLAAGVAMACGCGQATGPHPPQLTERSAPRPSFATTALDASSPPVDASDGPGVDTDTRAGANREAASAPVDAAPADSGDGTIDGPATCGPPPCAPGAPCADLVIDVDDLRASTVIDTRTFAPTDCAVVEGCITQPGTRRLLRFDTATANTGTGDLVVGDPTASACFEFSPCHQHYHLLGFSRYTLYETDGTTVAAAGHKQSFCLEDVEQYHAA